MNNLKISRISKTKRGLFALFVDDEFLFSVDDETMVKNNICEGSSFTPEELSLLKSEGETQKAKQQAFRYLSLRAYGEDELYKKLCLKYDPYSAAAAVSRMKELGLLNDWAFALARAEALALRKKPAGDIINRLTKLGVSREIAREAVGTLNLDESELAFELVCKQYLSKLQKGKKENVMAALARRGFSYGDIKSAIQKAEELEQDQD